MGTESLVGKIHVTNHPDADKEEVEKQPFAEYWMGDHVNGPSKVKIDKNDENL